jgi:hypothetical protein
LLLEGDNFDNANNFDKPDNLGNADNFPITYQNLLIKDIVSYATKNTWLGIVDAL